MLCVCVCVCVCVGGGRCAFMHLNFEPDIQLLRTLVVLKVLLLEDIRKPHILISYDQE